MNNLKFLHNTTLVSTNSKMYRPPCFPPPDDWVVSVDRFGNDLSFYGDDKWDFSAFGYAGYNFKKQGLDQINLALVKQAMIFVLYHPNFFPGSYQSAKTHFQLLVKMAKVCSFNNIALNELFRFPKIFNDVSQAIHCSKTGEYISYLHKFLVHSEELGFVIADKKLIGYLAYNIKEKHSVQTPYIPPRIFSYQLKRINDCLDDFLNHQHEIRNAFNWISDAYRKNTIAYLEGKCDAGSTSPFSSRNYYKKSRIIYPGNFELLLKDFGLLELFTKWVEKTEFNRQIIYSLSHFSQYLNLIRLVSIVYILNYSLQRRDEACSMKTDCFSIEVDHKLGPIALLSGETTKTDDDSDARWVTAKSVEKAVRAASIVANLRLQNAPEEVKNLVGDNPYLVTPAYEPWRSGIDVAEPKLKYLDYGVLDTIHRSFFDKKELLITEDDAQIALSLTPNLDTKDWFGVGKPWRFSAHQLRRTICVNMFASNMVSDSSLQFEMKHLSRLMSLYYGRNYTKLRLNSDVETQLIIESYKAIYRQFTDVLENSYEYVAPHSKINVPLEIVNLLENKEERQFIDLAKKGEVGCRLTLLGLCLKRGLCEYGGIESVSKCAGSDGGNICSDAIFIRRNKDKLIKLRDAHEIELKQVEIHSPRYKALSNEIQAVGIYLDVIERK